jgi:hypothetical protein
MRILLDRQEVGNLIDVLREHDQNRKDMLTEYDGFSWNFVKEMPFSGRDRKEFANEVASALHSICKTKLAYAGIVTRDFTAPTVTHELYTFKALLASDGKTGAEISEEGFDRAHVYVNSMYSGPELIQVNFFPEDDKPERFLVTSVGVNYQDAYRKLDEYHQDHARIYQDLVQRLILYNFPEKLGG